MKEHCNKFIVNSRQVCPGINTAGRVQVEMKGIVTQSLTSTPSPNRLDVPIPAELLYNQLGYSSIFNWLLIDILYKCLPVHYRQQ